MLSHTKISQMYQDFSLNTSSANVTRGKQQANIEHKYLLQKYFNNEASFAITTVGSQDLTLTGALLTGATTATLSSAWTYQTVPCYVTFSNGDLREVNFTNGSTTITWTAGLSDAATVAITVGSQTYLLPPDYSKLKTGTLTIGNLKWTPTEVLSREEWDTLNVFPYYADIPSKFYIWGNQFKIWPIPSTTGNVITFNYKRRVTDLSLDDYTTPGNITATNGSTTVTGSGTSFVPTTNSMSESRWLQIAQPSGDDQWYQIAKVNSATSITLMSPYQGNTASGATSYTIGQMPLLMEDFQDMLVWKPLMIYYSTISKDTEKFRQFASLYNEKLKLLDEYAGQKTINVNLSRRPSQPNPNIFWQV
jgi:hypothetical protein